MVFVAQAKQSATYCVASEAEGSLFAVVCLFVCL